MAGVFAAGVALGVLIGGALRGGSTSITNEVQNLITNQTTTIVQQLATLNVSTTISGLVFNIKSNDNVMLVINQSSIGNVVIVAEVVVEIVTQAVLSMAQTADLQNKSFLGIQFSDVTVNNITVNDIRNIVETKISQSTNIDDRKLIEDLVINVDNATPAVPNSPLTIPTNTGMIVSPLNPPSTGNVTINISQEPSNNIQLAATATIMNSLGVDITTTQDGKLVNSSDPITNFFDGLAKLFGVGTELLLWLAVGVVLLIVIISISKPSPNQGGGGYPPPQYYQQPQQFSESELRSIRNMLDKNTVNPSVYS